MSNLIDYGFFTVLLAFTGTQEILIKELAPVIIEESKANNLEPELVAAVIQVESSWYPEAESTAGACGLMQVIPKWNPRSDGTLYTCEELKDPETNIKVGTKALRWWMNQAKGDRELALCAYNAGYVCFKKMKYSYVKRVMNVYYTIKNK
jgi:soluble lytic murein transglycosylase-like protein